MLSMTAADAAKARELRGPLAALSSSLSLAFEKYADDLISGRIASPAQFVSDDGLLRQFKGRIAIEALARPGHGAMLAAAFKAVGASGITQAGSFVGGYVSVHKLDDLAGNPHLNFARPLAYTSRVGSVTSQGEQATRANIARSTYGLNGAGVKVGVISDSFNTGPGSYATDQSSGDLPAGIQVVAEGPANSSDEGRGMLQLIHDAAPGASLAFATAYSTQADFANNIIDLMDAGSDVIVDDIIYFAEPMFQDGPIAQAVDTVVAAGVPYFSAAGNDARQSYDSAFRSGVVRAQGSVPRLNSPSVPQFWGGTTHDFDPGAGVDDTQSFTLPAGGSILLTFQWDTPFASAGGVGADNDMDIYVLNNAGTIVGGAAADNVTGDGVEIFQFSSTSGGTFQLMLVHYTLAGGPTPGRVKYVNFGTAQGALDFATNSGTAYGHANAAGAAAVAAAPWYNTPAFGVNPPLVESFSAAGGIPILFDTLGIRLASPQARQTPDFTAADGGNTTFFGQDVGQDADTFPNFFGTSAAAPEAAAVAALMLQANPSLTPAQIYTALQNSAVDMDDPSIGGFQTGYDDRTGYGLIRADVAVASILSGTGSIAGKSFNDFDNDGVLDAGETPIAGATVYLDADNDATFDAGEASTTTNGTGDYSFAGLANATYNVRQVPVAGFNLQTGNNQVFITTGQSFTGINFANTPTGALAFTGTSGADTYLLRRSSDLLKYEIFIGGVLTYVIPQTGVTAFTFDLASGNDSLTLDYVNTNPIPAGGTVKYDGGGTSATDADSLTVNGSGAADAITIVNGNAPSPPAGAIILDDLTSTANSVELVTVNGNAGADALTTGINLGAAVTYAGGNESDTLVFNASPADDTINVTQNNVTDGTTPISFGVLENLTVNADFGFDTVNVSTGISAAVLTVNLGDGDDTANINNANTSAITVSGGNGNDRIAVFTSSAPITFNGNANSDTVEYNGTNGTETITVGSTSISRTGGTFSTSFGTVEALVVNALASTDTINASVSGGGITSVTLDGGTEADTFNVTPSSSALYRVIGGNPTTAPGDTLNITQAGAVQTGHGASGEAGFQEITYSNRQSVRYKEIETLGTGIEQPPTIQFLSASPNPVVTGSPLTLDANDVADPNGGTINVVFYVESNGTPGLQIGTDTQLGSDNTSPYSLTITAPAAGSYIYYAQAIDPTSLTSEVAEATSTVMLQTSATPGTPDLVAGSDRGVSSSDDLTNLDNSNGAKTLTFDVPGTIAGATVTLYADGTPIGSAVASGTTTTIVTDGTFDLLDGTRAITATQEESGKAVSIDSAALSVDIDTVAPAAPSTPDLNALSDSGNSNTDNYTNDATPTFTGTSVSATTPLPLKLFADGVQVGSTSTGSGTWSMTASTLADESYDITATIQDAAGNESAPSAALTVTIDTVRPTAEIVDVSPDPRTTGVNAIDIVFNEPVIGFTIADLSLTRNGGANLIDGTHTLTTSDNVTFTLSGIGGVTSPTGSYTLSVVGGVTPVAVDLAGNVMDNVATTSDTWINDDALPTVTGVFVRGTTWNSTFLNFLATSGVGDATLGYRLDAAAHADELPWTNLNRISVKFSENVTLSTAAAVRVFGVSVSEYAGSFTYDPATFTATWTLGSGTFANEKLLLRLDDGLVADANGNPLDGEWANPAPPATGGADGFPSGDGTAGGDFAFRFNVLPGDTSRNGIVQSSDALPIQAALLTTPGSAGYTIFRDVNGNGILQSNDFLAVQARLLTALPTGEPVGTA